MHKTAKLFLNGRSQAVRLPAEFRFDCDEVYIAKDPVTGNVILSRKPSSWQGFFEAADASQIPDDFLADRDSSPPQARDLF
ncbi:antitoxin [Halioxenophilus aromaticivorans]|uniref:AbrB/MazE/SpoVT family DNA-binding domain-containing protein n=1 Tax=Halioxenophilus aromaticivorans TaxID=1306992 RepID=A0AAV3TZ17_9ALTE